MAPAESNSATWRPSYLKTRTISAFIVAFLVLLIALEILFQYSRHNAGFVASVESRHYLWTYGPTAIFTLLAAIWSRIEYQMKQNAPWYEMSKGSATAARSVMLDYVSPIQPVALFQALKNLHLGVAASSIVSMLFRMLIVVSTGLMTLSLESVPHDNVQLTTVNSFSNNRTALANIGNLPYKTMQGIQTLNLSFPDGTSKDFAFQTFEPSPEFADPVFTAVVDGFSASLECEPAEHEVVYFVWNIPYATPASVPPQLGSYHKFITEDCVAELNITDVQLYAKSWDGFFEYNGTEGIRQNYFVFQNVSCGSSIRPEDQRIAISFGEIIEGPETGYNRNRSEWPDCCLNAQVNLTVSKSCQLLCRPQYHIQKVQLSANMTDEAARPPPNVYPVNDSVPWTLSGIHQWDIALAEYMSYQWAESVVSPTGFPNWGSGPSVEVGYGVTPISNGVAPPQLVFALRQNEFLNITAHDLFRPEVLHSLGEAYWKPYTAFIAKQYLLTGPQTRVMGVALVAENRVVVRELPLRLMDGALVAMVLLTAAMLPYMRSQRATTRDPFNLVGLAAILSASPPFVQRFAQFRFSKKGRGTLEGLSAQTFTTQSRAVSDEREFVIIVEGSTDSSHSASQSAKTADHWTWWQPIPLKLICRVTVMILVAVVIVALEVILYYSQSNKGLANIGDDEWLHAER